MKKLLVLLVVVTVLAIASAVFAPSPVNAEPCAGKVTVYNWSNKTVQAVPINDPDQFTAIPPSAVYDTYIAYNQPVEFVRDGGPDGEDWLITIRVNGRCEFDQGSARLWVYNTTFDKQLPQGFYKYH